MRKDVCFAFWMSKGEREVISALAEKLQRNESDAMRYVLNNVVREMVTEEPGEPQRNEQSDGPAQA